jgi:hypothetical protein
MDAPSIQRLNRLAEPMQSRARALADYLEVKHGWPIALVSGVRTPAEQAQAVATGHSWTYTSKHLAGLAADWAFRLGGTYSWTPPVGPDGDPQYWWKWLQAAARDFGLTNPAWSKGDLGHTEA